MVIAMRIRCRGYFDNNLKHLSRLDKVMDDIERFAIENPEFELDSGEGGEESLTFVAALFRETPEVGLVGWFVWRHAAGKRKNLVYCLERTPTGSAVYKHVLLCGAPEEIHSSAILTRAEARDLLSSLLEGKVNEKFHCLSFASVIERLLARKGN